MIDREQEEQRDEQQSAEVDDLEVAPEEAAEVKGGKVQMQDFHFVSRSTKSSP